MEKYGIIDVGSNSVIMLLAESAHGRIRSLREKFAITRLSEGLFETQHISEDAFLRTAEVVKEFCRELNEETSKVICFFTEPLRIAENKNTIIRRFGDEIDCELKILSPEEEAELAFLGAVNSIDPPEDKVLVIDLGGASTELIAGERGKMLAWTSIPLGAVKITGRYELDKIHSPQRIAQIIEQVIRDYSKHLTDDTLRNFESDQIIVVGGTATTAAMMANELNEFSAEKVDGMVLTLQMIQHEVLKTGTKSVEERKNIIGLESGREDIIVGGLITLQSVLSLFRKDSLLVSSKGARFGAIHKFFLEGDK